MSALRCWSACGRCGKIGIQQREGIAQTLFQYHLPVVGALRAKCIGGKVRTVSDVPTEAIQPCQGGLFDVGFCEGGQGVSISAAWISFNDRPSASFHSVRPLLFLPNRTPAAVEGEVKDVVLDEAVRGARIFKKLLIQQRLPQIGKIGVGSKQPRS